MDPAGVPEGALVSIGMDNNISEAAGHEVLELPEVMTTAGDDNGTLGRSLLDLIQELAAAPPHSGFIATSSGGRGRNRGGGVNPALREFLIQHRLHDYDLEAQRPLQIIFTNTNSEAGGQAHQVSSHILPAADAAQVQETSEVTNMIKGVMLQAFAAFLPACVTTFPQVKDAPDYVKLTMFGGLGFITVGLFVALLSKSVARCRLAFRLVSFLAIAVMVFSFASQFSSPTYITVTALVGVALNLIVMLLPFYTR